MATNVTEGIRTLQENKLKIEESSVYGTLILIDLVGSTAYKTRDGEDAWLSRLIDFIDAVKRGLAPLSPTKYLGDGVLGFYSSQEVEAFTLLTAAEKILSEITLVNQSRSYRGEHKIHVRVVLNYGKVFLFEGGDPQGTSVDKLFRIEKYVPSDCVGLTQEIYEKTTPKNVEIVGRYSLKGLADGRHQLYLLNVDNQESSWVLDETRRRAALHDIWDLGSSGDGKINIISGYIPPEGEQPCMIQVGDKEAVIKAYKNLCLVGRLKEVEEMMSLNVSESALRENVVCIGGPYWNQVTRKFMRAISSPFIFDFSKPESNKTPLIDLRTGTVYEATWKGTCVTRDIGFLGRFRNPFNPDRHVILVCGIETPSVTGLIQVFSDDQSDFMKLHEAIIKQHNVVESHLGLSDFFALIEFDVEFTGAIHIPAVQDQIRCIVTDWDRNNSKLQESPI